MNEMNSPLQTIDNFPISRLDNYLASALKAAAGKGLHLTLSYDSSEGTVEANSKIVHDSVPKNSVDFDLSACSCLDLDKVSPEDFTDTPFEAVSAHEFFDFAFMYSHRIECLVEFTGRAWKFQIQKTQGP